MFEVFVNNITARLAADDFHITHENNENGVIATIYKDKGALTYFLIIYDGRILAIDKCLGISDGYLSRIEQSSSETLVDSAVVLSLVMGDGFVREDVEQICPGKFGAGVRFNSSCWLIDVVAANLIIPEGQINDIGGFKRIISDVLRAMADDSGGQSGSHDLEALLSPLAPVCRPLFTYVLMLINIVVLILMELSGGSRNSDILLRFGALYPPLIFSEGQVFRLLNALFLHMGYPHLIQNCLSLFLFGGRFEKYCGHYAFLAIYVLSGLAGNVAAMLINPNSITAGASGAIFGLIGAMLVYSWRTRKKLDGLNSYTLTIMSLFMVTMGFVTLGVSNAGHIGGLLCGLLLGLIFLRGEGSAL